MTTRVLDSPSLERNNKLTEWTLFQLGLSAVFAYFVYTGWYRMALSAVGCTCCAAGGVPGSDGRQNH